MFTQPRFIFTILRREISITPVTAHLLCCFFHIWQNSQDKRLYSFDFRRIILLHKTHTISFSLYASKQSRRWKRKTCNVEGKPEPISISNSNFKDRSSHGIARGFGTPCFFFNSCSPFIEAPQRIPILSSQLCYLLHS